MLETVDMISAVIILIAVIINLFVFIKSINSWRENRILSTLLFALTAFFMAIAMLLLVGEKLFLSLGDNSLGMTLGVIAITLSGVAVVCIDAFAFNMVFPDKYKILTIVAICVEALYLGFWYLDPERAVVGGEIVISDLTTWLSYFTLVPLLVIPVLVFFYYAMKVRNESPVSSKRSWILGIGVAVISVGFIMEIAGLDPVVWPPALYIILLARSLFILGAILLYYGLFKLKAKE